MPKSKSTKSPSLQAKNGTGKSTMSRSLFSIFNSFYKFDEVMSNFKKNELALQLGQSFPVQWILDNLVPELLAVETQNVEKEVPKILRKHLPPFPSLPINYVGIKNLLKLTDEEMRKTYLARKIGHEFNG